MTNFDPLPDFLTVKRQGATPMGDHYQTGKKREIFVPKGIYVGSKLLGTLTDRRGEGFSARKPSGAHSMFASEAEALKWLNDGEPLAPIPQKPAVSVGLVPRGDSDVLPPSRRTEKPPRPAKVEAPAIEEAKTKMKGMAFEEVEAWAKKIGAKYEPIAPNKGVLRMRVQNAILVELRK